MKVKKNYRTYNNKNLYHIHIVFGAFDITIIHTMEYDNLSQEENTFLKHTLRWLQDYFLM